nr:helix-turn-helix transcriptional regulator [uncultured Draconibacterium sp.]
MTLIRKQKKLSQAELGKRSGINGDIVGKYERNEMKPSIETAKKLADALEVSLDYLVGNPTKLIKDKKILERLESFSKMPKDKKNRTP